MEFVLVGLIFDIFDLRVCGGVGLSPAGVVERRLREE
jgi:hypothetical protein